MSSTTIICTYCGTTDAVHLGLEPDGPGKMRCVAEIECEARIRAANRPPIDSRCFDCGVQRTVRGGLVIAGASYRCHDADGCKGRRARTEAGLRGPHGGYARPSCGRCGRSERVRRLPDGIGALCIDASSCAQRAILGAAS